MNENKQDSEDSTLPLHLHLEADHEEQLQLAEKLLVPLLDPES